MPEAAGSQGVVAMLGVAVFGGTGLMLSYRASLRPWSRVFGIGLLAAMPVFDVLGSQSVSITDGERWAFFTSAAIMMMLIAIAAIPIRPLQMAGLAALFIAMYAVLLRRSGADGYGEGPAGIGLVFLAMTAALCTALTRSRLPAASGRLSVAHRRRSRLPGALGGAGSRQRLRERGVPEPLRRRAQPRAQHAAREPDQRLRHARPGR